MQTHNRRTWGKYVFVHVTGCGRDSRQEGLWDALPPVILGVPLSDWTGAGVAWEEMRGILQGILTKNRGTYGPVDLLEFLENPPAFNSRQPFGKITLRLVCD